MLPARLSSSNFIDKSFSRLIPGSVRTYRRVHSQSIVTAYTYSILPVLRIYHRCIITVRLQACLVPQDAVAKSPSRPSRWTSSRPRDLDVLRREIFLSCFDGRSSSLFTPTDLKPRTRPTIQVIISTASASSCGASAIRIAWFPLPANVYPIATGPVASIFTPA